MNNPKDQDCICYGNWRAIVKDKEDLFDKRYLDENGEEYMFTGIVHASDDYYYLMMNRYGARLLSCVGSIEGFGYTLIEDEEEDEDNE